MKKNILPLLILSYLVTSCEKWLQPEPLSINTPETIFIDREGVESALTNMRKNLRKQYIGGADGRETNGPTLFYYEYTSSDYGVSTESGSKAIDFNLDVIPTGAAGYFYNWSSSWGPIRDANVVISRIDIPSWDSEQERNEVLGEAYFHRAFWYYYLVFQYGDVPFLNQEHTEPRIDFYTHSRTTILRKLQEDLEFAVEYLPETVLPGQVSKAAGLHLLTKIYLANMEFDKAISSSTSVISESGHRLMTERFGSVAADDRFNVLWDLHRPENKSLASNREGILVAQDKYGFPGVQSPGTMTMRLFTPWWSSAAYLKDPDGLRACLDQPGDPQLMQFGRGVGMYRTGNYLNYDIWEDCGADLRHDADTNWMPTSKILVNNPASNYYGHPVDIRHSNQRDTMRAYFPWPQYKTNIPDEISRDRPQGGNSDWYVFRLAETYLLRAEAYYWKGELSNAASDINEVRERAKAPLINSADVTIDYILDERARELYLEELRKTEITRIALIMAERGDRGYSIENFHERNYWFDRTVTQGKFYNKGLVWANKEYRISPYHVFWPIPQTAIDANSQGRINQNKGYHGVADNVEPLQEITDSQ